MESSKSSFTPSIPPGSGQQAHQASRQATTTAATSPAHAAAAGEYETNRNGHSIVASTGNTAANASSNSDAVPHSSGHAVSDSDNSRTAVANGNSNGATVMASNTATAMKRELQKQAVPEAKRQKMLSKESQAAMAVIAATARLPSQVIADIPSCCYCVVGPGLDCSVSSICGNTQNATCSVMWSTCFGMR